MEIILFLVCLVACIIGAISGIGGGIIIKPVIDNIGFMNIYALNFLSGCTVLAMSTTSLYKSKNQNIRLKLDIPIFLGIGASIGGIIGKKLFDIITKSIDESVVELTQSVMLLGINIFILIYMFIQHKLKTKNLKSRGTTIILGCLLGIISSFLGIGGGPLNIATIYYFYSLDAKHTTLSSLIVVFFSQLSSLIFSLATHIPEFEVKNLIFMCFGGIVGALIGSKIAKKMNNDKTRIFFMYVLIILIILNIINILKFYRIMI